MGAQGSTVDVTDATYEAEVLRSALPVVVDFWAPWCGPCKAISPAVEQIARERAGGLKVVKVDIDANPALAERLGIQTIPTLMMVRGGEVVSKSTGAMAKGAISRWIGDAL